MTNSRRSLHALDVPQLETVTDYRMIALGGGLLFAFVAVPLVLSLFASPLPALPQTASVAAPRPAPAEPVAPVTPMAAIRPQLSFPSAEPFPVRKMPHSPPPVFRTAVTAAAPLPAVVPTSPGEADWMSRTASVSVRPGFQRRNDLHNLDEFELLALLQVGAPEVSLNAVADTSKALLAKAATDHPLLNLLAQRTDLAGLPARQASECQANPETVKTIEQLSKEARLWRRSFPKAGERGASQLSFVAAVDHIANELAHPCWMREESVSTLEQVLQGEETPLRSLLVKQLATIPGPVAGAALARRAVFDVAGSVRVEAVEAMRGRPRLDTRPTLLAALRYPWLPVADHAAEALVNLGDTAAAPELFKLLDQPDPSAPAFDTTTKKWVVQELVRINHLGNCLLCHAPSANRDEPLRRSIPESGQPLPAIYYEPKKGPAVRADITYLRQDFSVIQRVEKADPWPEYQRFDYLLRKRELPEAEGAALAAAALEHDYPQRGAVLFALRKLSGTEERVSPTGNR